MGENNNRKATKMEDRMLKTEGERGQIVYMVADSYIESNEIMNKALELGLKELISMGEIRKGE